VAFLALAPMASRAGVEEDASAARLELLIPRLMKEGDVPGLSIAVVRDGRVAWHRGFGVRDASAGGAVGDDTLFEAASLSKPVFAYAVLKLVDAGRIDLDAPVERYLPGDYVRDKRISAVTVRRVLSHTAGFPNWRPEGEPLKILFDPGEKFSYSGEGFVYLQKAVERVTGSTLEALMEELVFRPLHMGDSSYVWQQRFEGRKATGHNAIGVPRELRRPAEGNAAASLQTTALDYGRFLAAVLEGTGLAPRTRVEMLRPQIQVDETCTNCTDKKPGRLSREIAWGLGWGLEENPDGIAVWHWGDNGSGFHCFVLGRPKEKSGVVIFTNSLDGHGIIPDILEASVGGKHPEFAWLDYERYDSAPRTWFKDIQARGPAAVADGPGKDGKPAAALTEQQVNRVGYWLLASKRVKDAIAVFEVNVAAHPDSWNVYDSLGEACAEDGQRERAIASYEKSLKLNPANSNGEEALQRLRAQAGK
jgi:CubicO group peptidase (beta-lactamase class C family)